MIWAAAFAIGIIAGLSRSLLVIATGAALIVPLCVAEIMASGADLMSVPLIALAAIGAFNAGLIGGALKGYLSLRRD